MVFYVTFVISGKQNVADLFPYSDIAARFKMQKDKNSYIVTYGFSILLRLAGFWVKQYAFLQCRLTSLTSVTQKGADGCRYSRTVVHAVIVRLFVA